LFWTTIFFFMQTPSQGSQKHTAGSVAVARVMVGWDQSTTSYAGLSGSFSVYNFAFAGLGTGFIGGVSVEEVVAL
jgi:hypothetical protein